MGQPQGLAMSQPLSEETSSSCQITHSNHVRIVALWVLEGHEGEPAGVLGVPLSWMNVPEEGCTRCLWPLGAGTKMISAAARSAAQHLCKSLPKRPSGRPHKALSSTSQTLHLRSTCNFNVGQLAGGCKDVLSTGHRA